MTAETRAPFAALRERPSADVLIIGGGINGLATFRDLALQGVDVALVERGDFVSGASSASSHMVHGGVRYLENGELRLVKEAVEERNRLLRTAPHYVRPLPTTIPIFRTFSGILSAPARALVTHGRGPSRERGAALIKLGLTLYDTFSRGRGSGAGTTGRNQGPGSGSGGGGRPGRLPRHRFQGHRASLAEFPSMNPEVAYTATYFDASMHDPERLALDVLHDGIAAGGGTHARAANYVEAVGASGSSVRLRDAATGEECDFASRVILNASGPWTDLTNAALGETTRYMGGTKGSHIVLDHPELLAATGGHEIFFEHSDGRIVLIYSLKGRVLVGTTDIEADPSEPVICTDDEIDYFRDLIGHVFPAVEVRRDQIVYTFSGIRPLPRHDDTAPGFVSRDYRIETGDLGGVPLLSLVGGKWTTFRALAERLTDRTLDLLDMRRGCTTRSLPIGGGRHYPRTDSARAAWIADRGGGRDPELVDRLLERYGTRATAIIDALPEAPETPEAVDGLPGFCAAELAHIARSELVVHLDDIVLRRTSIAFTGELTREALAAVARTVALELGWNESRVAAEIERTARIMETTHRVVLGDHPTRLETS